MFTCSNNFGGVLVRTASYNINHNGKAISSILLFEIQLMDFRMIKNEFTKAKNIHDVRDKIH